LLLERGSKVTGEYQSGLEQGAKRLFVLWNRVKTPNGVTINGELKYE
jgi:type IV secretion system protein VirB10